MLNLLLVTSLLLLPPTISFLGNVAEANEQDKSCVLMLLGDSSKTILPIKKSITEKIFSSFPLKMRSALAQSSSKALELHEKILLEKITELLPPEVHAQMVALFQTSQDYVLSWLPVLPKSIQLGKKNYSEYKSGSLGLNYFIREAQKITWGQRLKEAHKLLLELVKVQEARHADSKEIASTYFRLAVLYSYSYGFQGYLVGHRSLNDLPVDDNKGHLTFSALEYFRKALEIYENQLGPKHEDVLTLKYLMLRHANNGIIAHNNSEYRTMNGHRLPADPIMSEFVDAAKKLGAELWNELGSESTNTVFNSRRVLFYYVNRELHKTSFHLQKIDEGGSLFASSQSDSNFQAEALGLLLLIAKEASKSWIDDQLDDPHRKKFLNGLISDSRWYIQIDLRHQKWELIYDVQLHPEKYNYESLISILTELGLFTQKGPTTYY